MESGELTSRSSVFNWLFSCSVEIHHHPIGLPINESLDFCVRLETITETEERRIFSNATRAKFEADILYFRHRMLTVVRKICHGNHYYLFLSFQRCPQISVTCRDSNVGTSEKKKKKLYDKCCSSWKSNHKPPDYKSDASPLYPNFTICVTHWYRSLNTIKNLSIWS
jgi:hypothetical protein